MVAIVITVVLCLLASAFCSLSEASFYSIPHATVESLRRKKKFSAKYIVHVKTHINRYIASVLILNTLANTLGVSISTAIAVSLFSPLWQMIFPIVLTVLILLFGEITPKTIGVKQAKKVAPVVAVIFYYLTIVLSWTGLIWLCLTITKRWTSSDQNAEVSLDDINSLVNLGLKEEILDRQQGVVIKNILALKSMSVRRVMTPRQVVFSLSEKQTIAEAVRERGDLPFSRIPVFSKEKDHWVGLVLRRDAYNHLAAGHGDIPLRKIMRPIQFIPDSLSLDKLLLRFLKQRGHIVGVVDEWGSIAGLASLEDVLEEILGREIVDEYDETVNLQEQARKKSQAYAHIQDKESLS
ncbi:MAG: hemolysin family protein [Fibrobacter sp.]|jgi:CBS domain containing-hemolysin-like protein|nr:hemolysin family protein [Fibrobacter sp.]